MAMAVVYVSVRHPHSKFVLCLKIWARIIIYVRTWVNRDRSASLFLNISNAPSFLFVIIDSLNKNIIRFHVFACNKISKIKKIPKLRKSSRIYVPEEKKKACMRDLKFLFTIISP